MPAPRHSSLLRNTSFRDSLAAMSPKPVTDRDNGHTAKSYDNPLGIEYEARKRRALVPLDRLGQLDGNMSPLRGWPFNARRAARARWRYGFAKRAGANDWADEVTAFLGADLGGLS